MLKMQTLQGRWGMRKALLSAGLDAVSCGQLAQGAPPEATSRCPSSLPRCLSSLLPARVRLLADKAVVQACATLGPFSIGTFCVHTP